MAKTLQLSLVCAALASSLFAQSASLGSLTVTGATKSQQSLKELTTNVALITADEIAQKRDLSVNALLQSVSGISITSNGGLGSVSSLFLRGMGNNRTLVLIDGVRYQDPSSMAGANLSHLMAGDIERIEVIKGAQSGIWGADASAGVINIITKSATSGTHVSGNVEYGTYNTKKYGASASYANDAFEMKLSAGRIESDMFSTQVPKGEDVEDFEKDAYENTTLDLKAAYHLSDDITLALAATYIDALKDYDSYNNPDDDSLQSQSENLLYSLSYRQRIAQHDVRLKYEHSDFEREELGTTWGVKAFNGATQTLELHDNYAYDDAGFVLLGAGTRRDDVEYIQADGREADTDASNLYAFITNANTFGGLILTQSLRYDAYDSFDDKLTGKLGSKYFFQEAFFISTNIATGYNVPNMIQELNPWGASNDALEPENALSFDVTLGYHGLEVTYFNQRVSDLIEWYDPGTPGDYSDDYYKNLDGESRFQGIEVGYRRSVGDSLLLSSNYTYLEAEDKEGKALARRPKQMLNVGLDFYPLEQLHLGLYGSYVGARYEPDGWDGSRGDQTGKYLLVNTVVNYALGTYLSAFVKIDNLTDKKYQEVSGFATARRSYFAGINAAF